MCSKDDSFLREILHYAVQRYSTADVIAAFYTLCGTAALDTICGTAVVYTPDGTAVVYKIYVVQR